MSDIPKVNNSVIRFYCKKDDENCIGYVKSTRTETCVNKIETNECVSCMCQINRMVIELKAEGLEVKNGE